MGRKPVVRIVHGKPEETAKEQAAREAKAHRETVEQGRPLIERAIESGLLTRHVDGTLRQQPPILKYPPSVEPSWPLVVHVLGVFCDKDVPPGWPPEREKWHGEEGPRDDSPGAIDEYLDMQIQLLEAWRHLGAGGLRNLPIAQRVNNGILLLNYCLKKSVPLIREGGITAQEGITRLERIKAMIATPDSVAITPNVVAQDERAKPLNARDESCGDDKTLTFHPGLIRFMGAEEALTGKPFDILHFLHRSRWRQATLPDLKKEFWPDGDIIGDKTIGVHISKARRALLSLLRKAGVTSISDPVPYLGKGARVKGWRLVLP